MRQYPFMITALILGGVSFLWALLPWQTAQDAFFAYTLF